MKKTKRKSFNFYRSYYDVFNELEDKNDKLKFIEVLFDKQFLDIDPEEDLKGMVRFAYVSQMDSIEKQVKGYCDKTKTPLNENKTYPWQGSDSINKNPSLQEKEKEKEKEKEVDGVNLSTKVDIRQINLWIKEISKSKMYLEGIYRLHKLKKGSASELLNTFKEHLKVYPKKHNNLSDFKKHFASWLQIKNNKKQLSKYQTHTKGQL